MNLSINRSLCQGHARCIIFAPEIVDIDDDGIAVRTTSGPIPLELEAKAILVEANCPEAAVTIY